MYTFISLIGIRLSYTMHDAQVKQTPIKDQIWTYITLFNIQHSSETVILHRCGYFKHWKTASQFLLSHSPITYGQIICTVVFTLLHYSHVGELFQKHVLFPS